jgi:hypothetical protein
MISNAFSAALDPDLLSKPVKLLLEHTSIALGSAQ